MTDFAKYFDVAAYNKLLGTKVMNIDAVIDANRKSLEALKKANTVMADGVNAVATRQIELAQSALEDGIEAVRDLATAKGVEEFMSKQTSLFQHALEKSVDNARELSTLLTKAQTEAAEIVGKQFAATMSTLSDEAVKVAKAAPAPVKK